jgi:tRNA-uridine 2-sulfurtransferase
VHPRGRGRLRGAPHSGAAGGSSCGDLVRVAVRLERDIVVDAGFDARGCAAAIAAGSAAVELVEGAGVLEAARLGPDEIAAALGGLGPAGRHAAELAADALHRALGAGASQAARFADAPARTLVAMSGGVDSTVAALLAAERGDEVIGVTLELWSDPAGDPSRSCCSPHAVRRARELAHRLAIPHLTLDQRSEFRRAVVEDFVAEHEAGRTPNPCVRCNGLVRFDAMLSLAGRLGAARLATGHYARVEHDGRGPLLRRAADRAKDQTYMLSGLDPALLERLWFPLGELRKSEVREQARAAGLAVADEAESQDLCFLAGMGPRAFLERHAPGLGGDGAGRLVHVDGRVLGEHAGQHRFTVGQRRGLGLSSPDPLYVVDKDASAGTVTVGPRAALATRCVLVSGARLHRAGRHVDRVKLRYRSEALPCVVVGDPPPGRHERLELELSSPAVGVAPGQTACLLAGERIVGFGTIATSEGRRAA